MTAWKSYLASDADVLAKETERNFRQICYGAWSGPLFLSALALPLKTKSLERKSTPAPSFPQDQLAPSFSQDQLRGHKNDSTTRSASSLANDGENYKDRKAMRMEKQNYNILFYWVPLFWSFLIINFIHLFYRILFYSISINLIYIYKNSIL